MHWTAALNNRNSSHLVLILLVALCSVSGCASGDALSPAADTTATTTAAAPKAASVTPPGATLTSLTDIARTAARKPTMTPAPWVCTYLAGPGDTDVYSSPGGEGHSAGSIPEGTRIYLWRALVLDDGVTWYRTEWNDRAGYIIVRDESRIAGGCGFLTQTPTLVLPITVVPEPLDYTLYVAGDVGTVYTFSQTIPSENKDNDHTLAVHVDLPEVNGPEGARWVDYKLVCAGSDMGNLQWGWWSNAWSAPLPLACDDSTEEPISASRTHYLEIRTARDAASITYTLTIAISAYSP